MAGQNTDRRAGWLLAGLVGGVVLSYLWPAEEAKAVATDREERFAIATTDTGLGAPESVFVLDFLTGRLVGATLNQQTAQFTNFYARNIAADFQADAAAKPKFVMIPGRADLNSRAGATTSAGVLYVGELTTGKVIAYRFPFRQSRTALPVQPLEAFAFFPFREAVQE
ncbi:MAG: hypothetical protein Q8K78_04030 [Planctomycetaceae bacterium]|nr:hypothetical protein [Planctomycetaceae bacterium]